MKTKVFLLAALAALSFAARSRAEVSFDLFYDSLDPYGDWIEVGDYGYCWEPRDVGDNWRPYTNGEWVYTDAGWTWISEEPFGWATYHYGRWTRLAGHGWIWVPDTTWAPAWVSWRHSERYTGWAPLPPESRLSVGVSLGAWVDAYFDVGPATYNFVDVRHFGAPRLVDVLVPVRENVTIIRETRNVTNIRVVNNVVINNGPDYAEVARSSERPVRKLRLVREETVTNPTQITAKAKIEGDAVKFAAPRINAQGAAQPKKVAQKIARADIDNGWKDAGPDSAKLREKIKSEAKIPADLPARPTRATAKQENPATDETTAPTTAPGTEERTRGTVKQEEPAKGETAAPPTTASERDRTRGKANPEKPAKGETAGAPPDARERPRGAAKQEDTSAPPERLRGKKQQQDATTAPAPDLPKAEKPEKKEKPSSPPPESERPDKQQEPLQFREPRPEKPEHEQPPSATRRNEPVPAPSEPKVKPPRAEDRKSEAAPGESGKARKEEEHPQALQQKAQPEVNDALASRPKPQAQVPAPAKTAAPKAQGKKAKDDKAKESDER